MGPMCVDKYVIYLVAHRYPFESSRPLKPTKFVINNIWLGRNRGRSVGVIIDVVNVIPPQLFLLRGCEMEKCISGDQ